MPPFVSTDSSGRLLAGAPSGRRPLTAMRFLPDGLGVSAPSCAEVALPWDLFGHLHSIMDGDAPQDGWSLVPWADGRGGAFGVAVRVSGTLEAAATSILKATSTFWRKFQGAGSSILTGRSLPVLTAATLATTYSPELATLSVLCLLLCNEPPLRPRLDDASRMERLAADIERGMLSPPSYPDGLGRDTTDIHVAIRQAGLAHPYGRPLTKTGLPQLDAAADKVEANLRANPYREGRPIDRGQVERIIRDDYLDVEPWPFAALVDA